MRRIGQGIMLVACMGAACSAYTQTTPNYPTKPVRMIVPFARGGGTGSRRRGWFWGGDGARPPGLWHCVLRLIHTAMFAGASLYALSSVAQIYPSKAVRMIVPFAPGGSSDFVARILQPKLGEELAQPIVVDNRAGASGNIGVEIGRASCRERV